MSSDDWKNRSFGGLKAQNLDQIDAKFICQLCQLILIDPWQLLCCGTLLCKWCLKNGISDHEPFLCPFCQTKQMKKEALADRGVDREIQVIFILCYSCSWNGIYQKYLNHLEDFHNCFHCLDCDQRFFVINSYEEHRQQFCPYRSEPCGLPDCVHSIKSNEIKTHYLTDQHQQLLISIIMQYIHPQTKQFTMNNSVVEMIREEWRDIHQSLINAISLCEVLNSSFISLQTEINEMKLNLEQNLSPMIDQLKQNENDLDQNVTKLIQIQQQNQFEFDQIQNKEDQKILILDQTSSIILRFTLSNDRPFSLISSKFQTSRHGYPFTLRLSSTNDKFKEEYLSLSLTLHKGDFDNLLSYPFPFNIHLILCDQSEEQKDLLYLLTPSSNSSSFHRPTTEKNEEFQIEQFCFLTHLTNQQSIYVKDQIFFIRLFIDFMNNIH